MTVGGKPKRAKRMTRPKKTAGKKPKSAAKKTKRTKRTVRKASKTKKPRKGGSKTLAFYEREAKRLGIPLSKGGKKVKKATLARRIAYRKSH